MKYLKGFFQVGILMLAVVTLSWSTATGFRSLLLTLDSSDSYALKIVDSNGSTIYNVDTSGNLTTGGAPTLSGSITMANSEVISNSTDDTVRIASDDASVNVDIYSPNATNGTAALTLIGDVGADATDRFRIVNSADGTLNIQNDTSVAGTYVTKTTITSAGAVSHAGTTDGSLTVLGSGTSNGTSSVILTGDAGADATDSWRIQNSAAGALNFDNDITAVGTYVTKFSLSAGTGTYTAADSAVASITLQADKSDDNGDDWKMTAGTDGSYQVSSDASGAHVLKYGSSSTGAFVANGNINFCADAGANDTYACNFSPALTAYTAGQIIIFTANTANTGACSININGLGELPLKTLHDADPADNHIEAGAAVICVYTGTNCEMFTADANP